MPVRSAVSRWAGRARSAVALLRPREFALTLDQCPFCGITAIVRLRRDEVGVRCVRCAASVIHLSLGWVLRRQATGLAALDLCELSARGPLVDHLRRHARSIALSEYFADLRPGEMRDGVRCEDVQRLTYADASFDVITHTEVMEHVPDDARAFAELHRVLRPDGIMLFTVPLLSGKPTIERARLRGDGIEHLQAPEYHADPLRSGARILAFRDYGDDIVARLTTAGFARAWIELPDDAVPWRMGRAVICASRD